MREFVSLYLRELTSRTLPILIFKYSRATLSLFVCNAFNADKLCSTRIGEIAYTAVINCLATFGFPAQ